MGQINDYILKSRQQVLEGIGSNIYGERFQKSEIPSNLVIDFKRDFNKMASRLYNLQLLLEHCHRETKSEPIHEALGDAYEDFSEKKDEIIELVIGDTGHNYGTLKAEDLPEYEAEMSELAADLTRELGIDLQSFSQKYRIPSAENISQEIHGIGCKLKYKLGLDNSEE